MRDALAMYVTCIACVYLLHSRALRSLLGVVHMRALEC